MRRFCRWLFNGLTVLSPLLCVATVAIWMRSFWRQDSAVRGQAGADCVELYSGRGELRVATAGRCAVRRWRLRHPYGGLAFNAFAARARTGYRSPAGADSDAALGLARRDLGGLAGVAGVSLVAAPPSKEAPLAQRALRGMRLQPDRQRVGRVPGVRDTRGHLHPFCMAIIYLTHSRRGCEV